MVNSHGMACPSDRKHVCGVLLLCMSSRFITYIYIRHLWGSLNDMLLYILFAIYMCSKMGWWWTWWYSSLHINHISCMDMDRTLFPFLMERKRRKRTNKQRHGKHDSSIHFKQHFYFPRQCFSIVAEHETKHHLGGIFLYLCLGMRSGREGEEKEEKAASACENIGVETRHCLHGGGSLSLSPPISSFSFHPCL